MARSPSNGWHWPEWFCECAGTAVLMFAVVTAKFLAVRAGPPFAGLWWRIGIVGVVAGAMVVAVAVSPWGRRSGAHLNPAVTLGLWVQRSAATADLVGYSLAQLIGALAGFAAARVWGASVAREPVHWAQIAPSIDHVVSAGVEAVATAVQLAVVFWLLLDARRARWAAPTAAVLLTVAIVGLATTSGAGFNPVRGLSPDVVAGSYPGVWTFLVGPVVGALLAGAGFRFTRGVVTGKLRHDPDIPCFLACSLPHAADRAAVGLLPTGST